MPGEPTALSPYLPEESHTAEETVNARQRETVRSRGLLAKKTGSQGT